MNQTWIRFDPQFNIFLHKDQREKAFEHEFKGTPSIKDLLESLGVPHTEIAAILVNKSYVDFNYRVQHKDRITVFSYFTDQPSDLENSLVKADPISPRFILDVHLGKLTSYLRLLGFDCLYENLHTDEALAWTAYQKNRILLSRDRGLLKRKIVQYGYLVRSTDPQEQVSEVLKRYRLFDQLTPLTRCAHCNGLLHPIPKEAIMHRLQPHTIRYYDTFTICEDCGQIYWKGSHFEKLKTFLEQRWANPGEMD